LLRHGFLRVGAPRRVCKLRRAPRGTSLTRRARFQILRRARITGCFIDRLGCLRKLRGKKEESEQFPYPTHPGKCPTTSSMSSGDRAVRTAAGCLANRAPTRWRAVGCETIPGGLVQDDGPMGIRFLSGSIVTSRVGPRQRGSISHSTTGKALPNSLGPQAVRWESNE